jgi:exodeoxyribonuclease-5
MSVIVLSPDQVRAFDMARSWFLGATNSRPVFRLFGLAGTGKTTVIERLTSTLGLGASDVVYTATTGKAAKVLTAKGCKATTVHKAFYRCVSSVEELWAALGDERASLVAMLKSRPNDVGAPRWHQRLGEIDRELAHPTSDDLEFRFMGISNISPAARLVIVDEASMLADEQYNDLCELGIPVILVGDHGQLPPVNGGTKAVQNIDVALETIHRQGKDSSILGIASRARSGRGIPIGNPEVGVEVRSGGGAHSVDQMLKNAGLTIDDLASADQIICGTNDTRIEINEMMRVHLCDGQQYPTGHPAEKLIVTQNFDKPDAHLMNGSFIRVAPSARDPRFNVHGNFVDYPVRVVDIDGDATDVDMYGLWLAKFECDRNDHRLKTEFKWAKSTIHAEWGWAITAHKSQGSQWDRVCVINESRYFRDDAKKWLYTAVTRARRDLLIIHP